MKTFTFRHRTTGERITIEGSPEAITEFYRTRDPIDWQELPRDTPQPEPGASSALRPGMIMERSAGKSLWPSVASGSGAAIPPAGTVTDGRCCAALMLAIPVMRATARDFLESCMVRGNPDSITPGEIDAVAPDLTAIRAAEACIGRQSERGPDWFDAILDGMQAEG